jgi:plastocyanin
MRAAVLTALAALLIAPAAASAQGHGDHMTPAGATTRIGVQFGAFDPPAVDVLAGDRVTWTNDSVRRHDITTIGLGLPAAPLAPGESVERMFDAPGDVQYFCSIHPFMRGTIGVRELLLDKPGEAGAPGKPLMVHGRTAVPSGTPIAIEADTGEGFAEVAKTAAGADGTFSATLRPKAGGQLRAVAAGFESPAVPLLVLDRKVTASGSTTHGKRVVRTEVLPASPGALVVLQLRLREHFGWWPVRSSRLDSASRATFRIPAGKSVRARVVLTMADGATPLAVSPVLRLGRSYAAKKMPGGHHH